MTHPTPLENRVAALISAYADRAATDVDPMAMARIVAGPRYANPRRLGFRSVGLWLGFAVVVMAALISIVLGVLVAGGQPLRREPASVIAQFGRLHVGYVYIYADGQVVLYPDIGATLSVGQRRNWMLERRLTQEGVDLVRFGAIDPSAFLTDQVPESAWAAPAFMAYSPPNYAICYWDQNEPIDASRGVSRLPAPAQVLLRGKERTYDNTDAGLGAWPPLACSEVTAAEAHILADLLADAGFHAGWFVSGPEFLDAGSEGGYMGSPVMSGTDAEVGDPEIWFHPILPHGTWVVWGG
jgi:hypothetical protein